MNALNGQDLQGARLEISLAKVFNIICIILNSDWLIYKNLQPPSDKKKKEEMLRKREQRMMQAMAERLVILQLLSARAFARMCSPPFIMASALIAALQCINQNFEQIVWWWCKSLQTRQLKIWNFMQTASISHCPFNWLCFARNTNLFLSNLPTGHNWNTSKEDSWSNPRKDNWESVGIGSIVPMVDFSFAIHPHIALFRIKDPSCREFWIGIYAKVLISGLD